MQAQIRPCPKCGGKMKLLRGLPSLGKYRKGNSNKRFSLMQCLSCNYKTEPFYPEKGESGRELDERVIALWNNQQ